MTLFVKGLFIGMLLAIPVGPSGAISVRRTLTRGSRAGFLSGIGSSLADVVYLAILEYAAPRRVFFFEPALIRGAGGLVTLYIGARLLMMRRGQVRLVREVCREVCDDKSAFLSSFLLSIVNPSILISLSVLLNGFGLDEINRDSSGPPVLMAAVFCGSALLWFVLGRWLAHVQLVGVTRKVIGVAFISAGVAILVATINKIAGNR